MGSLGLHSLLRITRVNAVVGGAGMVNLLVRLKALTRAPVMAFLAGLDKVVAHCNVFGWALRRGEGD